MPEQDDGIVLEIKEQNEPGKVVVFVMEQEASGHSPSHLVSQGGDSHFLLQLETIGSHRSVGRREARLTTASSAVILFTSVSRMG